MGGGTLLFQRSTGFVEISISKVATMWTGCIVISLSVGMYIGTCPVEHHM